MRCLFALFLLLGLSTYSFGQAQPNDINLRLERFVTQRTTGNAIVMVGLIVGGMSLAIIEPEKPEAAKIGYVVASGIVLTGWSINWAAGRKLTRY